MDISDVYEEPKSQQHGPVPQLNLNKLSRSVDIQNEIIRQSKLMWNKGKATDKTWNNTYQVGQVHQVANIE